MARLSISKAWDETREILARDGRLIAIVAAAMVLVPSALAATVSPGGMMATPDGEGADAGGAALIVNVIANLLSLLGTLSITAIALNNGITVGGSIRTGARKLFPMLGAILLYVFPMVLLLAIIIATTVGGTTPQEMLARLREAGGTAGLLILLWAVAMLYLVVRFLLASPVAVAETSNPLQILKRSWALTAGNFWRLFAYLIILLILVMVLAMVAGAIGGILATLIAGQPEPMSVSALIVGLLAGLGTVVVVALSALMSARLYAQHAGEASVPRVSAEA